ncbi:hypothetical protein N9981_00935 [bacterium]|nr:hypothetical protein [bacterium]
MAHVNTFETPSTTHFMNFKTSFFGTLALTPLLSMGQAVLSFSDQKTYRQFDDRLLEFEEGALNLSISEGNATIAGCADQPSLIYVGPYIFCPLGTTGYVTAGDVDGDGIRDTNRYFSIASIQRAFQVEPFQTSRIRLIAAPPSTLSRPLGGANWVDSSIVIWYDYVNFPIQAYELTRYASSRTYGENQLQRQLDEIVPGTYIFETPRLNDDLNPFPIRITHIQMIEAWPGRGRVPGPNEFTLLEDGKWVDGALEVDPRIFFRFNWRGFNGDSTVASDSTFFSMEETNDLVGGPTGQVVFPPYNDAVPDGQRFPELIGTPSTFYELGPGFAAVGDEWTANLQFTRNLFSTSNSRDTSSRTFRWNVRFVETYEGFVSNNAGFSFLVDEALLAANADYDDDGVSNIIEFGLQSDPVDPASLPNLSPVLDPVTSQCVFIVPKRPSVGSRLRYQVEYTTDRETWTTILVNDPLWFIETDNEDFYRVRSRFTAPPATCLLRVKITQN